MKHPPYNRLFYNETLDELAWEIRRKRYQLTIMIDDADLLISNDYPLSFKTTEDHAERVMQRVRNTFAALELMEDEYEWMYSYAFSNA